MIDKVAIDIENKNINSLLEVKCDLRIKIDNIIGYKGKFLFKKDVQVFTPSYQTYVNQKYLIYDKYTFLILKYNIKKHVYIVEEKIEEGNKHEVIIPFDGFIICLLKTSLKYQLYINKLKLKSEITLSNYSSNKSNYIFINEKRNTITNKYNFKNNLSKEYFAVYNVRDNTMLFEHNANIKAYPASVTKIVTALVALKYARLEDKMIIGNELDICYEGSDPSTAGLKKGQVWNLRQLLYAMLLPSGNDAAYSIATLTIDSIFKNNNFNAKTKIQKFSGLMNDLAKECGANNSHFMTPDGNSYYNSDDSWSDRILNHYITANDIIMIANYALNVSAFMEVVSTPLISFVLETKERFTFKCTNRLLDKQSPYYFEGNIGLKTGTTNPAGYCLVSAVEQNRDLIIVSALNNNSNIERYINTIKIYKTIFK